MESFRLILFGLLLLGNDAVKLNLIPVTPSSSTMYLSSSSSSISNLSPNTVSNKKVKMTTENIMPTATSNSIKRNTRAETELYTGPYRDGQQIINITTQRGASAFLPCKVKQPGNKSVSWIRVRDDHILSVDRLTFIADERFQALPSETRETEGTFTLLVKYVQDRDEGLYECQVSTEPKVSARVFLKVVVPRTEIIGDTERYIKAGSTVILRCVVRGALEATTFIMWYHSDFSGTKILVPDNRKRIQMDRGLPGIEEDTHSTIGTLLITTVKKNDAGNYTCTPSNSVSTQISLHVINGEYLASAITSAASQDEYRNLIFMLLVIVASLQT